MEDTGWQKQSALGASCVCACVLRAVYNRAVKQRRPSALTLSLARTQTYDTDIAPQKDFRHRLRGERPARHARRLAARFVALPPRPETGRVAKVRRLALAALQRGGVAAVAARMRRRRRGGDSGGGGGGGRFGRGGDLLASAPRLLGLLGGLAGPLGLP